VGHDHRNLHYADAAQPPWPALKIRLVTAYRGGPDVDLAVERGEVDGRMSSWTLLKTSVRIGFPAARW